MLYFYKPAAQTPSPKKKKSGSDSKSDPGFAQFKIPTILEDRLFGRFQPVRVETNKIDGSVGVLKGDLALDKELVPNSERSSTLFYWENEKLGLKL